MIKFVRLIYVYSVFERRIPVLAIRLPYTIEERLNTLAAETGRTKTALAREAIVEYIVIWKTITWLRPAPA